MSELPDNAFDDPVPLPDNSYKINRKVIEKQIRDLHAQLRVIRMNCPHEDVIESPFTTGEFNDNEFWIHYLCDDCGHSWNKRVA